MQIRLFVLGCILLANQVAFGQTFGSIGGEVHDSTGATVSGVTVTLTNAGTNATRAGITNEAGGYSFPSLPPGTYTIRIEKPGFKTSSEIRLNCRYNWLPASISNCKSVRSANLLK